MAKQEQLQWRMSSKQSAKPHMPVACQHRVLYLETGDHLASVRSYGCLGQVPFRTDVHVIDRRVDLGKRGDQIVSQVEEPLEDHTVADVVVIDRELVVP